MSLDRRQFLAAAGACAAACRGLEGAPPAAESRLDALFRAHAEALPEREGAGANHYPMAAEALTALGYEQAIDDAWVEGVSLYAGELPRARPIATERDVGEALGDYVRFGDWLAFFRDRLAARPWRAVVGEWVPRLAPALCAAAYHGVIRTGHAVRALRQRDTPARRGELAVGLAYWASRYVELPDANDGPDPRPIELALREVPHPWLADSSDVGFFGVVERMAAAPPASAVPFMRDRREPREELDAIVHAAAAGFLEMLVQERHRIWVLHAVTGPAAVEWLLPELDAAESRRIVGYARQSVVAMFSAFGAPFAAGAHVRGNPAHWDEHVPRAVESRSVHGIKLIDALTRFDRGSDPLMRSVAAQWFEWT